MQAVWKRLNKITMNTNKKKTNELILYFFDNPISCKKMESINIVDPPVSRCHLAWHSPDTVVPCVHSFDCQSLPRSPTSPSLLTLRSSVPHRCQFYHLFTRDLAGRTVCLFVWSLGFSLVRLYDGLAISSTVLPTSFRPRISLEPLNSSVSNIVSPPTIQSCIHSLLTICHETVSSVSVIVRP